MHQYFPLTFHKKRDTDGAVSYEAALDPAVLEHLGPEVCITSALGAGACLQMRSREDWLRFCGDLADPQDHVGPGSAQLTDISGGSLRLRGALLRAFVRSTRASSLAATICLTGTPNLPSAVLYPYRLQTGPLEDLILEGTDFDEKEEAALELLPITEDGLNVLLQYLKAFDGSYAAWTKLFYDFDELLTPEQTAALIRKARQVFDSYTVNCWLS